MSYKICGQEVPERIDIDEKCEKKDSSSDDNKDGFSEEEWLEIQRDGLIKDKETDGEHLTGGVIETNIGNLKIIERICIRGNQNKDAVTKKLIFEVPGKKPFIFNDLLPEDFKLKRSNVSRKRLERLALGREGKTPSEIFEVDHEAKELIYSDLEETSHVLALFHEWGHIKQRENIPLGSAKLLFKLEGCFYEEQEKKVIGLVRAKLRELTKKLSLKIKLEELSDLENLLIKSIIFPALSFYHSKLNNLLGPRQESELDELKREAEVESLRIAEQTMKQFEAEIILSPDLLKSYSNQSQLFSQKNDQLTLIGKIIERLKKEKIICAYNPGQPNSVITFPEEIMLSGFKSFTSEERGAWSFALGKIRELRKMGVDLTVGKTDHDLAEICQRALFTYQNNLLGVDGIIVRDIRGNVDYQAKKEFMKGCHQFTRMALDEIN